MRALSLPLLHELGALAVVETLRQGSAQMARPWNGPVNHGLMMAGWSGKLLAFEDIVGLLWANGSFPRVVDLAVAGALPEGPLVLWIPTLGQTAFSVDETYDGSFGPFKPVGMMLPGEPHRWTAVSEDRLLRLGQEWIERRD